MPYANNEALPDSVKTALPVDAQSIFRNAFNSTLEKTNDEEKAMQSGWGAVKNAGYEKKDDKWIKMKEIKTYKLDAEILSAGVWNGYKFTPSDIDELVNNFNELKDEIKPPLKLGHNDDQNKDGQPSLGWCERLYRVGNKLMATFADIPEIVNNAIGAKRYKRISVEIYNNYKNTANKKFKNVLSAVALLGADIPAVKNLEDLKAYLSQSTLDSGSFDEVLTFSFDVNDNGAIQNKDEERKKAMSEEKTRELEAKLAEMTAENERIKKELEAKEQAEIQLKQNTSVETLKTFCEDMVKGGKMTPAARDALFPETDKIVFAENSAVITIEKFREFMDKMGKQLDESEKGKKGERDATGTATKRFADAIDKRMTEKKIDYVKAFAEVAAENPALSQEYMDETENRVTDED